MIDRVVDRAVGRVVGRVVDRVAGSRRLLLRLLSLLPLAMAGACSSVDVLNAISSASSHRSQTGIPFGAGNRQVLDVYQPVTVARDSAQQKPVVIFFYGGSWNRGERKDYAFVGHSLAQRGYVTVIPDYRLYPEVRFPDFLRDNAQAIAWVHANIARYGGNPSQLFVMGHSAGAYNASMMALDQRWLAPHGLTPSVFKGWVGISGAYNFLPIGTPDVQPVFFHPNYPKDSQPIDFVNPHGPASFLATSPEDDLINPKRNTFALANRLNDNSVPVTLKTYERVDHISIIASLSWPLRFKSTLLDDLDVFLQSRLTQPDNVGSTQLNNVSKQQTSSP